jgi:23S rRNA (adenine-N6)-dimethyltransferase
VPAGRVRWGFHRLTEPHARALVHAAGVARGDLVLDVGAGDGVLTAELLSAGARVLAFELHPARARALRERFRGSDVIVVEADAGDLRLPRRPYRVVANPPFSITTSLLRRLLAPGTRLVSADIVLPSQVAARWAAGRAPDAQRWGRRYDARVVGRLPPNAFVPPSPMAAVVLRIERRRGADDPHAPPASAGIVSRRDGPRGTRILTPQRNLSACNRQK